MSLDLLKEDLPKVRLRHRCQVLGSTTMVIQPILKIGIILLDQPKNRTLEKWCVNQIRWASKKVNPSTNQSTHNFKRNLTFSKTRKPLDKLLKTIRIRSNTIIKQIQLLVMSRKWEVVATRFFQLSSRYPRVRSVLALNHHYFKIKRNLIKITSIISRWTRGLKTILAQVTMNKEVASTSWTPIRPLLRRFFKLERLIEDPCLCLKLNRSRTLWVTPQDSTMVPITRKPNSFLDPASMGKLQEMKAAIIHGSRGATICFTQTSSVDKSNRMINKTT